MPATFKDVDVVGLDDAHLPPLGLADSLVGEEDDQLGGVPFAGGRPNRGTARVSGSCYEENGVVSRNSLENGKNRPSD